MRLEFRRLDDAAAAPSQAHVGDAGWDLRAIEAVTIGPGERASVGTGIAVAIPAGHAGLVLPRSGLSRDHGIGLVNSPGLIDAGYRGELRVLLINHDPATAFVVSAGDRIAQLLIVAHEPIDAFEVATLEETDRSGGGFGSSGR
ncbi:MAG: dUTP diphosphatase [Thermoleophilaceae bacterium]|nr:dUTP diphosphatase [Thermoleophilaceae bacterium]